MIESQIGTLESEHMTRTIDDLKWLGGVFSLIQCAAQEDVWCHSRHSSWNMVGNPVRITTCSRSSPVID